MLVVNNKTQIVKSEWLDFEVVLIDTKKKFDFFIKRNKLKNETISDDWNYYNGSCTVLEDDGLEYFVIIIKNRRKETIVHECVHMVHMMMEKKGIPINYENTEVMAYLTGWLFKNIDRNSK
jgi:hypothetical protein